jgi:hypothetical protein
LNGKTKEVSEVRGVLKSEPNIGVTLKGVNSWIVTTTTMMERQRLDDKVAIGELGVSIPSQLMIMTR